jgi:hypothetical protein
MAKFSQNTLTQAFLYKWTEKSTNKWYIGSRTAIGCHPDDGYICSSKIVNPKIKENPADWVREILCLDEPEYILDLEMRYLRTYKVRKDPMSYNDCVTKPPVHNKPHSEATKQKIREARAKQIPWNKGKGGYKLTDEHRKHISAGLSNNPKVGKPCTEETKQIYRDARTGVPTRPCAEETKKKISMAQKGKKLTAEHIANLRKPKTKKVIYG